VFGSLPGLGGFLLRLSGFLLRLGGSFPFPFCAFPPSQDQFTTLFRPA
jgi:hypothetical protein